MRARLFNLAAIGRAGAVLLAVVIVVLAAVLVLTERAPAPRADAPTRVDPLAEALARCQMLGARAEDDPACLAAWGENRQRFFTYGAAQVLTAKGR